MRAEASGGLRTTRRTVADVDAAIEAVGYTLITSQTLYRSALAALEGAPQERLEAIRARIGSTNGLVNLDDLLGEGG